MTIEPPFKYTAIRFGLFLAISLIAVFMVLKALELTGSLLYRFIDVALICFFVGRSLHYYQENAMEDEHGYFRNVSLAVATSFFGMLIFTLFLFIYLSLMDEGYLNFLREIIPMGAYLNPTVIAVVVLTEGVAIGALSGLIHAYYLKRPLL